MTEFPQPCSTPRGSHPAELCPCLLQPLPGNPWSSWISPVLCHGQTFVGFLSAPVVVSPVSDPCPNAPAQTSLVPVKKSVLSFESQHFTAQLIPKDEDGRNFPGSHRFSPFSAELIHLPHPHTPPSWLGCLHPHHGPIAGNYFHTGFSSATNFATFTIPVLNPMPPGGSQRQRGAGINPGHGARATSTRRYQPRGAQAEVMSSHGSCNADTPGVGFLQLLHHAVK